MTDESDGGKIDANENLHRKTTNSGAFSELPERMSKKHIRDVADEFNVDISGLKLNIEDSEELLDYYITGDAAPEKVGNITFFPNAFRSKEELLRTLVHEREHVKQFRKYGSEFVQNNRSEFEKLAYETENKFIDKLKKEGSL